MLLQRCQSQLVGSRHGRLDGLLCACVFRELAYHARIEILEDPRLEEQLEVGRHVTLDAVHQIRRIEVDSIRKLVTRIVHV